MTKAKHAAPAKRGMKATAKIDRAIAQWKRVYMASKQVELQVTMARSVVNGLFDQHEVDYFTTKLGTIARQSRAPGVATNWEALARKLIPANEIEAHLPSFTTTSGSATAVLAAPSAWTVEAGC